MSFLTQLPGVPDTDAVKPGMASHEGSGPYGKTCEGCIHRGYWRDGKLKFNERSGLMEEKKIRTLGCRMFLKLSGRHGPVVDKDWKACKYFEAKAAR